MTATAGRIVLALGVLMSVGGGTFDLISGWPGLVLFWAGLVLAGVGLTIWQGPDWMDH